MVLKNYNGCLNLKKRTINIALTKGQKESSENGFKKIYKHQCKISLKAPATAIKSLTLWVAPCFSLIRLKSGKSSSATIPAILRPNSRVFYGLKTITDPKEQNGSGLFQQFNSQISKFSSKIVNSDNPKLRSAERAFECKAFAQYRWF